MMIYLNEHIHPEALETVGRHAEIVQDYSQIEEIHAIIVRTEPVTREIIEKAKNLKVIGKHGIGYDNIDVEAAKELGVSVVYTPTANFQAVAELIVTLMSSTSRNIVQNVERIKGGKLTTNAPADLVGTEMVGKTVALIGMGNVALTAAAILRNGYQMNITGYDPFVSNEKATSLGIKKYDSVAELLPEADYINVSVPLTDTTRNIISENELRLCKRSAILINTSRGGTVNETDLYQALKDGTIRAAASDVFVTEPPTLDHPLIQLENFVPTPHIGASTEESMYRMGTTVVREVLTVLAGDKAKYHVL
ncbi:hydroxyacid dehydrogenase [Oceanobacillus bengalensis]|uniref:3-phosphoglycerate dehydrogenase n=1 Tax=Oceanobacillus bengalensis TaxID=1435466 RepID=A0A494YYI2_9BACI|nr:hydroxyacid dehydrogenase [Oceanobacillus bengalensis]RKQ14766.1 3-phosphoglycerate dehydrogenase [Oceanobacillus bengalensis]